MYLFSRVLTRALNLLIDVRMHMDDTEAKSFDTSEPLIRYLKAFDCRFDKSTGIFSNCDNYFSTLITVLKSLCSKSHKKNIYGIDPYFHVFLFARGWNKFVSLSPDGIESVNHRDTNVYLYRSVLLCNTVMVNRVNRVNSVNEGYDDDKLRHFFVALGNKNVGLETSLFKPLAITPEAFFAFWRYRDFEAYDFEGLVYSTGVRYHCVYLNAGDACLNYEFKSVLGDNVKDLGGAFALFPNLFYASLNRDTMEFKQEFVVVHHSSDKLSFS